jgi:hypothetical protein
VKDGKLEPMAVNVGGKTEKIAAAPMAPEAAPKMGEMKKDDMKKDDMKKGDMKKDEKKM